MFAGLSQLEVLNMTVNRLASLSGEWFKRMTSMKVLDVSDNKITYVDVNIFTCMENLKIVKLGNNAYNCECPLSPFADWLRNESSPEILDREDILCLTPFGDGKTTGMYGKRIDKDYDPPITDNCDGLFLILIIVPVAIFLECVLLIALLFCRCNGTSIRYWAAKRLLRKRRTNLQHAYVLWDRDSESDKQWVDGTLRLDQNLLRSGDMNCDIVHARSMATKPIADQIREAGCHFKCFLLIITENFLQNIWPDIEENASDDDLNRRNFVMLLAGVNRLSLPQKLWEMSRKQSCFSWPDVTQGCTGQTLHSRKVVFWRELRMAIRGVTTYPGSSCCLCCLNVV
jgi:hypothetical protein